MVARLRDFDLTTATENEQSTKLWAENWYDGLTYCKYMSLGMLLD